MAVKSAASARLERVRAWMAAQGMDAFLVRGTSDIAWLSAFEGVFDEEAAHALLVLPDRVLLHTDSRYSQACEREAQDGPIQVDASLGSHAGWCAAQLGSAATLGFDSLMSVREHGELTAALPDSCHLVSSDDALLGLRAVKDQVELERLREAQAITDAAFEHILGHIAPGMSEREVQLELDGFMHAHGAEGLAFATIVATGAHASNPHAQPGEEAIKAGHAVVMDFGARKGGYCSDMTRTVFVGEPSLELRRAWDALRRANEECEALLRPGISGCEVHEHSQKVLAEEGFAGLMGHGLGHGVGLDIHELPVLSPRNPDPLGEGCVVTVEPGIYVPGSYGMRLEDCGWLGPEGFVPFSSSTHEMVIV